MRNFYVKLVIFM